jgi:hypothetical protein
VRYRADWFLMCAAAHTRIHFFCLSKRNEPKKKTPDDLPHADARGSLRFSAKTGAAELAIFDRSDSPRFSRFCPVMLGRVNGSGVH